MKSLFLRSSFLYFGILVSGAVAQAPANDTFASRQSLPVGLPQTVGGTTVAATADFEEPNHASLFGGNVASNSVWFEWTSDFDGSVTVTVTDISFDAAIGVYTGSVLDSLVEIAASDAFSVGDETAVISVQSGVSYLIAVDGFAVSSTVEESGTFNLEINQAFAAENDDFSNPISLSLAAAPVEGNIIAATAEVDEPAHAISIAGNVASNSVWYSWIAPADALVGVDVVGAFDLVVGVYTGSEIGFLTEIGAADFYSIQRSERAEFFAQTGVEYFIAVDGFSDGGAPPAGLFQIQVFEVPPNDYFALRIGLESVLPVSVTGTTVNGSSEFTAAEPDHGQSIAGNLSSNSVWYSWEATGSGSVDVEVSGAEFDPVLSVYTGSGLAVLSEVGSADSGGPGDSESVTFETVAGTVYVIVVDDWSGTGQANLGGTFTLEITGDLVGGGLPYSVWIAGYPDLIGAEAEPEAMPLGDGVSNLMKLILGLSPILHIQDDPNKANLPVLTTFNGNPALRYTIAPENIGTGVGAILHGGQISDDLSAWNNISAQNVGGDEWVIEIPSTGTDARYGRLRGAISNLQE